MLSVNVNKPDTIALTTIESFVFEPTIEPLPVIDHLCVTGPAPPPTVDLYTRLLPQAGFGPEIVHVGFVVSWLTFAVHESLQPVASSVTTIFFGPAAFQRAQA